MGRRELFAAKLGWAILLGAVALGAGGGCWEEIEYTSPNPAEAKRRAALPTAQEQPSVELPVKSPLAAEVAASRAQTEATNFGEDLAESLPEPLAAVDETESMAEPASEATVEGESAAAAVPEKDRYSMPTAETFSNYASADSYGDNDVPPAEGTLTAAAVDAPELSEPVGKSTRSELAAWQLGGKLSLAALANDRGVAAEKVQQWLADSKSLAASLGTATDDLPQPVAADGARPVSREVLNYLLSQGQQIGRDLARQHSHRHSALFEMAMKSNLLHVLYEPGSAATEKISASISDAAKRTELPAELWQPLLDALAAKVEPVEVRKSVQRLHADVERHLAEGVER